MTRELTIVSANLGAKPPTTVTAVQQARHLRWIIAEKSPDVICLQDAGKVRVSPHRRYRLFRAPGARGESCPILVKRDLPITGLGYRLILPESAGRFPVKGAAWISVFGWPILNVHGPAHIEKAGRPRAGAADVVLAAEDYWDEVAKLAKRLRAVAIVGDTNVDAEADHRERHEGFPTERLGRAGYTDILTLLSADVRRPPTLGARTVDRAFLADNSRVIGYRVLPQRHPFNHSPVHFRVVR